nr:magnesium and cobalt transport protein CorA [Propionicicella superfundia]
MWVGMKDPSDDDLAWFADFFGIHPLVVDDAVNGHDRSKLEVFEDTIFLVVSTAAYVDHATIADAAEIVTTGQVMVFLTSHFVLTVRRKGPAQMRAVRSRLERHPEQLAQGTWRILYEILDGVVDDYARVAAEMEEDVDEVEEMVFADSGTGRIDRAYLLKRELIEFRRCAMPVALPLLTLAQKDLPNIPLEARAYFREVSDHHVEVREALTSFDDILSTVLQAALARQSVADNQDMRKISAAVGILAVPTAIAGIYGMNFQHMPELATPYGYYVVLVVMAVLMLTIFFAFRRNKWL